MIEVRFEKRAGVTATWVRRVLGATLKKERSALPLDVLVTGDRQIRKLNKRFLRHDYVTDVISFPGEVGGVVVSVDTARRLAKELKVPFKQELARYLVHGTLHLLGYDDKKKKDFVKMHKRQERILTMILATR